MEKNIDDSIFINYVKAEDDNLWYIIQIDMVYFWWTNKILICKILQV